MYQSVSRLIIVLLLSTIVGCNRENETTEVTEQALGPAKVALSIDALWGNDAFAMQDVYLDSYGNRVRVDNFQLYITFITLVRHDGTEVILKDFHLQNFADETTLEFEVTPSLYTGIKFGLGIPSAYNLHIDPATYPSDHALSVAGSQGMFWTWNTGYIFSKFEGKADTTGTDGEPLLHSYSFHTGDNECYMEFVSGIENFEVKSDHTLPLKLNVHVDEIFGSGDEGIDVATETGSAGASALGILVSERIRNAITID